ncbi:FRG domain-containing protein [Oerskovia merdavium]|uniref:FRG domain-containing protein n=1 Tax=Oerskovia merdavium TaxID=2762227 RepID=A0ABR8U3E0_9CELL|nr:FRG domain-containing protein [Oerskovia merdavium]MBD7982294.1 FRG domain-containing protein [Oerskovia merdavium]
MTTPVPSPTTATPWPAEMVFESGSSVACRRGTKPGTKLVQQAALEIVNAVNSISISGPEGGIVWRGQADVTWRVESKATRQKKNSAEIRDHEIRMLETIRKTGADRAQYTGDWELLARLRHHAAATRLMGLPRIRLTPDL